MMKTNDAAPLAGRMAGWLERKGRSATAPELGQLARRGEPIWSLCFQEAPKPAGTEGGR